MSHTPAEGTRLAKDPLAGPSTLPKMVEVLGGVERCPHCGTATPTLEQKWVADVKGAIGSKRPWSTYACNKCGGVLLAKGVEHGGVKRVTEIFPALRTAHADIPEPARTFLQQAIESRHAPDGAAMLAGSAVDAMLKQLGYEDGSVYNRINKAVDDHKLTEGMGAWAHKVRFGSNFPRHVDNDKPHVSQEEAEQSVEYAEALGYFLFVLKSQIERGMEAAEAAAEAAGSSSAEAE